MARNLLGGLVVSLCCAAVWAQDSKNEAQAPAKPAAEAQATPTDGGPMRIEPWYIAETRINFLEPAPANPPKARMEFHVKLLGDRVGEVHRKSRLIITSMKDDLGNVLWDAGRMSARFRNTTIPNEYPQQAAEAGFIEENAWVDIPPRNAKKIAQVDGYMRVVLTDGDVEGIFIEDPVKKQGTVIDHPRLKELGLEVRLLSAQQLGYALDDRSFAIDVGETLSRIRNIAVYDDWFRLTPSQVKPGKDREGKPVQIITVNNGTFSNDCELVLFLYKRVDEQQIDFTFTDLDLP